MKGEGRGDFDKAKQNRNDNSTDLLCVFRVWLSVGDGEGGVNEKIRGV